MINPNDLRSTPDNQNQNNELLSDLLLLQSKNLIKKSLQFHKFEYVKQKEADESVLSRLKNTFYGRLYINFVKPIPVFRALTNWLWRNIYPNYHRMSVFWSSNEVKRWRPLIKLSDYVKKTDAKAVKILDAVRVNTPVPKVHPLEDQDYLNSPHKYYDFPEVYVVKVNNALIYGGTNLVFTKEHVIFHDLYDFERDYTSEELHGRHLIDVKKKRIRLLIHDKEPLSLKIAAVFVDSCAANYAHWLTEVLPRIAVFCSNKQFDNIPIVINEGLHENIMESLAVIVGSERRIILLPVGHAIKVELLYVTSVAGYVPFERRNKKLSDHSHGMFNPLALDLIRKKVDFFIDQVDFPKDKRKIYLRRSSGVRNLTNAKELECMLLKQGYVVVEPEKLPFLIQAALFKNAEIIIGSSGAAFANLIFASKNTSVHILIGKYKDTSYWYWQNISCSSYNQIQYTLCDLDDKNKSIHSDFKVDLINFIQKL